MIDILLLMVQINIVKIIICFTALIFWVIKDFKK